MITDKEKFILIIQNITFIYLKEKDINANNDSEENQDIVELESMLLKLENYTHIPDKKHLLIEHYQAIKSSMMDRTFKEEIFFNDLNVKTKELDSDEKNYILNAIVFVANTDKKISDKEKEIIVQVARALNIELSYKEIMNLYKKSEFNTNGNPKLLIGIGFFILLSLIVGIFWKSQTQAKIQTFATNKYQFDEITFNRYILYKNKFDIQNNEMVKHFKKYAVYYISGTAKISFNPKKITYDPLLKTIILEDDFRVDLEILQKDEIDKVSPKSISKGTAKTMGVVVGLAATYSSSHITSKVTDYLPNSLKMASKTGLGLVSGATAYLVTSKALEGAKLTSDISMTDKKETLKIGEMLIKAQLLTDDKLVDMYRKHFESFIKAKYKTWNKEVDIVKYSTKVKEVK